MSRLAPATPRPPRAPRDAQAGFTLIEMMIVVVIIAISAALAAPTIITAFAERRANMAAIDLVRLGREARASAIAYNRAHVLRYTTFSSPGSDGRVQLFRGIAGGCNANNWVTIMGGPVCGALNSMCIDETNMGEARWQIGNNVTRVRAPGYSPLDICFQPNGAVMMRYNAGINGSFFDGNTMSGGVVFTVQRINGGSPAGPTRRVVFPLGSTPRVVL